jgi:hypothetical protein
MNQAKLPGEEDKLGDLATILQGDLVVVKGITGLILLKNEIQMKGKSAEKHGGQLMKLKTRERDSIEAGS